MYIDDCRHTFEELATSVLPAHMARLRAALDQPHVASIFSESGKGRAAVLRELGRGSDFSGCYVMLDGGRPIYVGISRNVIGRLRQHLLGKTHYEATLAYAMAQDRRPTKGTRNEVMGKPEFRMVFDHVQMDLRKMSVASIEIDNPVELYLFEAYAALSLHTWEWNTFRTH